MNNSDSLTAIISGELIECDAQENAVRTSMLSLHLSRLGVDYRVARGHYKGADEASYVVVYYPRDAKRIEPRLMHLARLFAQESVLFVDANNRAELRFVDSDAKPVALGRFVSITEAQAIEADAYTKLGDNYYGVLS